jgi:DNA (cytosine-5)-methyltransferase 1
MHSAELFGGCGGLALGLARAGFRNKILFEQDPVAIKTLLHNQRRRIKYFADWEIAQSDVRLVDFTDLKLAMALVSGGPPCQPFSIGGKHLGPADDRNLWPEAIRAVREMEPQGFLFENVRGLLRPDFAEYLAYIILQLRWPSYKKPDDDTWEEHAASLSAHDAANFDKREYEVAANGINAADYGAAQKRHRVIVMGTRRDVASSCEFPGRTHTQARLVWDKYISGEYWDRHGIRKGCDPAPTTSEGRILTRLRSIREMPKAMPWVTVRDRLCGLPLPEEGGDDPNHVQHPGARAYRNHTGSVADEPAKALKAGAHGVPGGENMLALPDGSVRYFTIRELARLQGFPDNFICTGSWRHVTRQLGNAVPTEIGEAFGSALADILGGQSSRLAA